MWVSFFIFSKIPELVDTVFLVLQKKPVIFLHWFHHVTVLLYCWHAYTVPTGAARSTAPGLWFATINYCVHSVMYFYYFLSISGGTLRSIARPIAPFITAVQLLQMVLGSTLIGAAAYYHTVDDGACAVHPSNYRLGLAMYLSYFVLFGVLFYNLYLKPGGKHAAGATTKPGHARAPSDTQTICGVEVKSSDGAGFFHGAPGSPARKSDKKQQ